MPLYASLLGGIGLFLLGMLLMSDGLKAAAGSSLQRVLERTTKTRLRAVASGALLTGIVQSSSATTLVTIGFVSAGLLSFSSAFGVLVGANIGTTSTGWIVALLGLRLNLGQIALPLIGVGALMRLFSHGRTAHLGMALAGFGLLFVGIETLRVSMEGVAAQVDLSGLTGRTFGGKLLLVLVGAVMTVVLQSSSAAVALTLTAVHQGALQLDQAAYLVIGQNVGTTVKALLAGIGGTLPARRTAIAHVVFNVIAGILAFIALRPILHAILWAEDLAGTSDPALALTIFHTVYNVLGAMAVLPFLDTIAGYIVKWVPDRQPALVRNLDKSLYDVPVIGVRAAQDTLQAISRKTFALTERRLKGNVPEEEIDELALALEATHAFLGALHMHRDHAEMYAARLAALHAGDHLGRLLRALKQSEHAIDAQDASVATLVHEALDGAFNEEHAERLSHSSHTLASQRKALRVAVLQETATGHVPPAHALSRLDGLRYADRLLYHAWRAVHHLAHPDAEADAFRPQSDSEFEG